MAVGNFYEPQILNLQKAEIAKESLKDVRRDGRKITSVNWFEGLFPKSFENVGLSLGEKLVIP